MKKILINQALPNVFLERSDVKSEIWNSDICFEKGKTYLIEAESGSGKSSLCSFIYGYRTDYRGLITFDEKDVKSFGVLEWDKIRCKHLSLMFQELLLFSELTAWENVKLKNSLTHFKKEEEITSMFEELGIGDQINKLVGQMSYGQQQRVAVIRTLCQPLDFMFLDEPISHLDDNNANMIAHMVKKEADKQGAGIIVTSIGKNLPLDYTKKFAL